MNELHSAIRNNDLGLARALIEAGACVNAQDEHLSTPLHNARSIEAAQLLISGGACVNASDEGGQTPLHELAFMELPDVAIFFIRNGADHTIVDRNGNTALAVASLEFRDRVYRVIDIRERVHRVLDRNTPFPRSIFDGLGTPLPPELDAIYRAALRRDEKLVVELLDAHRLKYGEPEQIAYFEKIKHTLGDEDLGKFPYANRKESTWPGLRGLSP